MGSYPNDVGVLVPNVLLPPKGTDFEKWAVVACDQYTSQPEYWERVREIAGDEPTTLDLILPEAFLGQPDEAERIAAIRENMEAYLRLGVLEEQPQGFVLVRRTAAGKTRNGLVMALDLEQYDYHKGSTTLIRATEGTIESRIPPRLRIREGAPLELPHILVLIDDPERTVIEPLVEQADRLPLLYDTDLMLGGGHVEGRLVSDGAAIRGVLDALTALTDADAFHEKYGDHAPLLFAMGDGNHSFATAKANWEQIKAALPEPLRRTHPARYALVEVENVHDAGIVFEPIHRVVFGVDGYRAVALLQKHLAAQNGGVEVRYFEETDGPIGILARDAHVLPFFLQGRAGRVPRVRPVAAAGRGHAAKRHRRHAAGGGGRDRGLHPRRRRGRDARPAGQRHRLPAAGHGKVAAVPDRRIRRRAAAQDLFHGRGQRKAVLHGVPPHCRITRAGCPQY